MKKAIILLVLLAAAGGGGYWYWTYSQKAEPPQINYATISRGDIVDTVGATGQLEPLERVQVGSQVSGQIKELYADFNSVVRKGQLLARLDPKLIDTQILQSEANLTRSQTDVERNQVQLEDSKRKFERAKELFDRGVTNRAEYENADLALKSANASLQSSLASLKQSQASLEQQKVNRENTEIYSPIDGIVVSRMVDVGQTINAGQQAPTLFNLAADLAEMRVVAGIDEADIGRVRAAQHVTFSIDAYPNETFTGTVQSVRLEARMQQNVVTYQAVITVPNPGLKLRPGMTANIKIEISRKDDVVRVPNAALRFRPTSDMYVALGLEPPAEAGRGGRGGAGQPGGGRGGPGAPIEPGRGGEGNGQSTSAAPSSPAAPGAPAPAGAQAAASGGQRSGGSGRGGGENDATGGRSGSMRQMSPEDRERMMAQMTPEERERMMARGGGRGGSGRGGSGRGGSTDGRSGSGRGGRGSSMNARGGQGGRSAANSGPTLTAAELATQRNVSTIDSLFPPLPLVETRGRAWTLVKEGEKYVFTPHNLRLGISDGNVTEIIEGDLTEGQQVVSNIITAAVRQQPGFGGQGGNPFIQGGRGGPGGGRGPGGGGPPPGGGGGGGNQGGGGNRGGGGGGGGGRGGF